MVLKLSVGQLGDPPVRNRLYLISAQSAAGYQACIDIDSFKLFSIKAEYVHA